MVRGAYRPVRSPANGDGRIRDSIGRNFLDGTFSADQMLRTYCTLVYVECGNYVETARRLGVDRRTVRSRIDPALVESLREHDTVTSHRS